MGKGLEQVVTEEASQVAHAHLNQCCVINHLEDAHQTSDELPTIEMINNHKYCWGLEGSETPINTRSCKLIQLL